MNLEIGVFFILLAVLGFIMPSLKKRIFCNITKIAQKITSRRYSRSRNVFYSRFFHFLSKKNCLPSRVVFNQRLSYIKGRLTSKVVFHQRSSFINCRLRSKVVFHQRSSSIKDRLPSKVVFHHRSSSIKGCLTSKVIFHQRLSSI